MWSLELRQKSQCTCIHYLCFLWGEEGEEKKKPIVASTSKEDLLDLKESESALERVLDNMNRQEKEGNGKMDEFFYFWCKFVCAHR